MKRRRSSSLLWGGMIIVMVFLVACSQPAVASSPPDEVVDAFYRWYLGYPGNAMVNRAYRDSDYLSDPFKAEVDEILDSFTGGGYDPFLMAQDIPEEMTAQDVSVSEDKAVVTVAQRWSGGFTRQIEVELQLVDGTWLISGVVVPEAPALEAAAPIQHSTSPDLVVQGFYAWYLDYVGGENRRNPLVDETWRSTGHLTERLVAELDELLASFKSGGYDPFLCAQDIPDSIAVGDPIVSGASATVPVTTNFEGHGFEVVLSMGQDGWKIASINCGGTADGEEPLAEAVPPAESDAEIPADWQVLRDERYGFEIWYPADWAVVEIPLRNPELDAPLVRVVQLLPAEWGAKMTLGGAPDPDNDVVAPVSLEVGLGTLEEYRRLYYEMAQVREIEISGAVVSFEQDEPSDYQVRRYVFQHPANSDLRITLVDYISGFTDRAAGNEAIVNSMNQIVATFSFTN